MVFGNELLQAIPTPGHTAGCLSFLWRDRLFCGGLLSVDTCPYQPRPVLPEALWDSATRHVFTLPDETLLFCGHTTRGWAAPPETSSWPASACRLPVRKASLRTTRRLYAKTP